MILSMYKAYIEIQFALSDHISKRLRALLNTALPELTQNLLDFSGFLFFLLFGLFIHKIIIIAASLMIC